MPNPYRGLRPFQEADAGCFFGRERLSAEIHERLAAGEPLVALVGPSGSGKSSVLAAGVLAVLRASSAWVIVEVPPDLDDRDAIPQLVAAARSREPLHPSSADARVLLVMDQFEEHLVSLGEAGQGRLLDGLLSLIGSGGTTLLLALRADLYDRPLRHAGFAARFVDGVVNVLPMTPGELESAVVKPAARVGVATDPALLTALAADSSDRPGQLPLLQYALTELFDRDPTHLDLEGYRAIGGLKGALSRRAEKIRADWSGAEEEVAAQLLLRLVRVDGGHIVRRRAPVGEVGSLVDVDPVAVSEVLRTLARHHLVTFDRDPLAGSATIEVAHEALFGHWPWLADLIDRHRAALERHGSLRVAYEEWAAADGGADYLLRGARLELFQQWRRTGALQLSEGESAFLDASQAQSDAETAAAREAEARRRRAEGRARRRLWYAAAVLVGGVSAGAALLTMPPEPARIAWAYHRIGYADRFIELGIDRVAAAHRFTLIKVDVLDEADGAAEVERLAAAGEDLVFVSTNETDISAAAARHADTRFVTMGPPVDAPNVTAIGFAHQEGAFLAGAAAALTTQTGVVGFIGGADTLELLRFEAGFAAGARHVAPDIRVIVRYLSRLPVYDGFVDVAGAAEVTRTMVAEGADVVFPAAGGAQVGSLNAIADLAAELDRPIWGIGADEDMYALQGWQSSSDAHQHVLTSMLKRFDVAAYDSLTDYLAGDLEPGERVYGLANGGLGLATSGGFLEAHRAHLDQLRHDIIAGRIEPPCAPEGVGATLAAAADEGPGCD